MCINSKDVFENCVTFECCEFLISYLEMNQFVLLKKISREIAQIEMEKDYLEMRAKLCECLKLVREKSSEQI